MVQKLVPEGSKQKIVGLTGGFGSGKSAVLKIFEALGAFTIQADPLAHEALEKTAASYQAICAQFPSAVKPSGDLDRKKIATVVFSDPEKRKQLEVVIHPYVLKRIREEIQSAKQDIVIVEVPLLFETGFDAYFDYTLVVNAPKDVTMKRLQAKHYTVAEIQARRDAQMTLEDKMARSDFVLENSGTLSETQRVVEGVWKQLRTASKGEN